VQGTSGADIGSTDTRARVYVRVHSVCAARRDLRAADAHPCRAIFYPIEIRSKFASQTSNSRRGANRH